LQIPVVSIRHFTGTKVGCSELVKVLVSVLMPQECSSA